MLGNETFTELGKKNIHVFQVVLDSRIRMYAQMNQYLGFAIPANVNVKITKLGCSGTLSTCISIGSLGQLPKDDLVKKKICSACKKNQSLIPSSNEVLIDESKLKAYQLIFIQTIKKKLQQEKSVSGVLEFELDSIKFCKIAFFDWSIRLKLTDKSDLEDSHIKEFLYAVIDLLIIFNSTDNINIEATDNNYLIYINGNYSQNTLLREIFSRKKISSLSIEPQPFSNRLLNKIAFKKQRIELGNYGLVDIDLDQMGVDQDSLKKILDTFSSRFEGKEYNAYTTLNKGVDTKEEVRLLNNFCSQYKKINTYFAHSSDEVIPHIVTHSHISNEVDAFQSQDEIIEWIIINAVNFPKIGFIIRLHPRMAVNKRDGFESSEHIRIVNILSRNKTPENVMIFKGNSKVSSYYLLYKSSMVFVGWSTIGLEALALGKPTISMLPGYAMYPIRDISFQPTNRKELIDAVTGNMQYGAPNFYSLAAWMSYSYEYQFIQIPMFRQFRGIIGVIGYIFHKITRIVRFPRLEFMVLGILSHSEFKITNDLIIESKKITSFASDEEINNLFFSHLERWKMLMIKYAN